MSFDKNELSYRAKLLLPFEQEISSGIITQEQRVRIVDLLSNFITEDRLLYAKIRKLPGCTHLDMKGKSTVFVVDPHKGDKRCIYCNAFDRK